jgi:hypothetical protein
MSNLLRWNHGLGEDMRLVVRYYDSEGRLLHVAAMVTTPEYFIQHHKTDQPWVRYIYYWREIKLPFADAKAAVKKAIKDEYPIFLRLNTNFTPPYKPPRGIGVKRSEQQANLINKALKGVTHESL